MARVTTEDCTDKVANRFELVMLAAFRARELSSGKARPEIEIDNDKNSVLALREIAGETESAEKLRERAIISHQTELVEEDEEFTEMDMVAMTKRPSNVGFKEYDSVSEADALRAIIKQ